MIFIVITFFECSIYYYGLFEEEWSRALCNWCMWTSGMWDAIHNLWVLYAKLRFVADRNIICTRFSNALNSVAEGGDPCRTDLYAFEYMAIDYPIRDQEYMYFNCPTNEKGKVESALDTREWTFGAGDSRGESQVNNGFSSFFIFKDTIYTYLLSNFQCTQVWHQDYCVLGMNSFNSKEECQSQCLTEDCLLLWKSAKKPFTTFCSDQRPVFWFYANWARIPTTL